MRHAGAGPNTLDSEMGFGQMVNERLAPLDCFRFSLVFLDSRHRGKSDIIIEIVNLRHQRLQIFLIYLKTLLRSIINLIMMIGIVIRILMVPILVVLIVQKTKAP